MAAAASAFPLTKSVQQPQLTDNPSEGNDNEHNTHMDTSGTGNQESPASYDRIAQAVAALLSPTITAAVDRAVSAGILQLCKELGDHSQRIMEAEQRIFSLEDDQYTMHVTLEKFTQAQQHLHERMEDLENRSSMNNLQIIGLPKSFKHGSLLDICTSALPEALGLHRRCTVERAHRIGAPSNEQNRSRPIIAKYLNYADRPDILQSFRKSRSVLIEGHKLLIFADYSAEVSRKCKEFQPVCAELFKRNVSFTLAYPAVLCLQAPDGEQLKFQSPEKATAFLHTLSSPAKHPSSDTYTEKVKSGPREQRSPRKDLPKHLKHTSSLDQLTHR